MNEIAGLSAEIVRPVAFATEREAEAMMERVAAISGSVTRPPTLETVSAPAVTARIVELPLFCAFTKPEAVMPMPATQPSATKEPAERVYCVTAGEPAE